MPRETLMPARIDHVAICSDHDALNGRFYGGSLGGVFAALASGATPGDGPGARLTPAI
jgi:hypothetical protein